MRENLHGETFGRLTVIGLLPRENYKRLTYRCKCVCGNIVNVRRDHLLEERTLSCGCLRREVTKDAFLHNPLKEKLLQAWAAAKSLRSALATEA